MSDKSMYIKPKSYEEICREFGGEIKNNVCWVNGYPMDNARYLFNYKPQSQRHVTMRPEEFLSLVPMSPGVIDKRVLEELKRKIKEGVPLDPLFLDVDVETGEVKNHEGRHRALACDEVATCEKVPVILYYRNEEYRYVDITGKKVLQPIKR